MSKLQTGPKFCQDRNSDISLKPKLPKVIMNNVNNKCKQDLLSKQQNFRVKSFQEKEIQKHLIKDGKAEQSRQALRSLANERRQIRGRIDRRENEQRCENRQCEQERREECCQQQKCCEERNCEREQICCGQKCQ